MASHSTIPPHADDEKRDPFVEESNTPTPAKRRGGVGFIHIVVVWVLISLLAVNIAVLYVLHFHDKPPTPSFTAVGSDSFLTVSGQKLGDLSEGTPVSVTEDGKIAVGAGTSFYLSPLTFSDVTTKYVQNKPLSEDTTLVSYYNGQETVFNITSMSRTNPRQASSVQVGSISGVVQRVVTLSPSLVMLVASNDSKVTDFKNAAAPVNLMLVYPATISDGKLNVLKEKGVVVNEGLGVSVAVGASAMDATRMAITMYGDDNGVPGVYTVIISVNEQQVASTSKPILFHDNNNYSTTFSDPVGFNKNELFLPFFNTTGLCARYATVNDAGTEVTMKEIRCLNSVAPSNFMAATGLDAATGQAAIIFSDSKVNNAIRVLDVERYQSGLPSFGSLYTVDNGDAFLNVDGPNQLWYQLNIGKIGKNRVVVAYSDMANQGMITAQVLSITPTTGFLPITSPMPISPPVESTGVYVWKEIAYLENDRFSVVYTFSKDGKVSSGAYNVGEVYATPLGMVGAGEKVLVSGAAKYPNGSLSLGTSYYTTTKGELLKGRRHGDTYPYVMSPDGKTVVSRESYVGVAADETTIILNK